MDGILIVDKPGGITSYQVVAKVKKILKATKVGHGGTLDPLATGVLPIFLNRATKLVPFLMNGTKMYRATLRLGITTDTQDREGNIIAESSDIPADHQLIINTFNSFKGTIEQIPPMFSALKVHGTPLYKLARKGIVLTRKARTVTLHEIKVLDISLPHVTFEVWCSPGTYIRTLCADIGKKLECGAHLVELERLQNGSFRLSDSISLDQLNRFAEQNSIAEKLFSLSESFKALPSLRVENQITTILRKGGSLLASHLINTSLPSLEKGTLMKLTCQEDALIAIVQSLINNSNGFSALSDKTRVCKLVCFFNPQENTLH
ncbi:MAG: tRNA pseudouridine(55) synthase TruB [Deltaproteobacteria bacterium]|nr:tRNA pseudouridine(55) synthase TruB [Deltaproteobacteria bacterium]